MGFACTRQNNQIIPRSKQPSLNSMNARLLFALALIAPTAWAADLPAIPAESIAIKKGLLFSDDFEGSEPAKVWHRVVPTFVVEKGMLKGSQTRDQNIRSEERRVGKECR